MLNNMSPVFFHIINIYRLLWIGREDRRLLLQAIHEYQSLRRIAVNLRRDGGVYDEITSVISDNRPVPISHDLRVIYEWLKPLNIALRTYPKEASCFETSIRAMQILRDHKVPIQHRVLRFGVRRSALGLRGHAWVEYLGQPLLNAPTLNIEYEISWSAYDFLTQPKYRESNVKYSISNMVFSKQISDDETIIVNLKDGLCYGVSGVSCQLWQDLICTGDIERYVAKMMELIGDSQSTIVRTDAENFIRDLLGKRLIFIRI